MPKIAVVNTSCLIALSNIEMIDILCKLYEKVLIPAGVLREFGEIALDCSKIETVDNPLVSLFANQLNLGRGESEVITLAFTTENLAIIDDQRARGIAKTMGLKITGTIGLLLKSEQMKFIESAYEKVIELKNKGFYVSDALLKELSGKK